MNRKTLLQITSKYLGHSCHSVARMDKTSYFAKIRDDKSGIQCYTYLDAEFPNTFIIVFLASNESLDWKTNFNFFKKGKFLLSLFSKKIYPYGDPKDTKVRIHGGYVEGYLRIKAKLREYFDLTTMTEICCIGYSMGGGIAPIAALDLQYNLNLKKDQIGCGFDGPRVFNKAGQVSYDKRVPLSERFMYGNDIVAKLPPQLFGFYHVGNFNHVGPDLKTGKLSIFDHAHYNDVILEVKDLAEESI